MHIFHNSWYDGDYYHPMATVGMGQCNSIMVGLHAQVQPIKKAYLDAHYQRAIGWQLTDVQLRPEFVC